MRREPRGLLAIIAMFSFIIAVAIGALATGCASLGLGPPVGRAIPLAVKPSGELGTCASSGYEVDIPPHATVATVASVCVRPYASSSADAGASSDARTSLPSVADTAAQAVVRELEAEASR